MDLSLNMVLCRLADMEAARMLVNTWLGTEGQDWHGLLALHAELWTADNEE